MSSIKTTLLGCAALSLQSLLATAAFAGDYVWIKWPAPEIDGPAGIAAIALLASAGIVAYNRYRK